MLMIVLVIQPSYNSAMPNVFSFMLRAVFKDSVKNMHFISDKNMREWTL